MNIVTLTIPAWAAYALLAVYCYYQLWSVADNITYCATGAGIRAWDVRALVCENIGLALRLIRRRPHYGLELGPELVFGFSARYAYTSDVTAACKGVITRVEQERWTYPASQRECVYQLGAMLFKEARDFEALVERGERMRDAYQKSVQVSRRAVPA
jgi:hypothetical protein